MSANEKQIGGVHYKNQIIEPWDYITANNIGYLEGNVIKYISRWKHKSGLQDLEKAKHYLEKLIEINSRVTIKGTKHVYVVNNLHSKQQLLTIHKVFSSKGAAENYCKNQQDATLVITIEILHD